MNHNDHDGRDNHDHTCCQVPSHVSDACPGARVVASLDPGQLFTLRQSAVDDHDKDGGGNDHDSVTGDCEDENDDDDVVFLNKLIHPRPPGHSA